MTDNHKVIQIDALSFTYPDGHRALDAVSIEVQEGDRVAILGPNGAGKSTLLLHLNGILHTNGRVVICGMTVEKVNFRAIRSTVGLVFQNPDDQLFCPTAFDDVAFAPRNLNLPEDEVANRVRRSLAAVGLAGFENRSAFHLSMGEKKRLAIATILSVEPAILALDEPTSNLDPRGRREIIHLLKQLGRTQVIVTHDLNAVGQLCNRAIVLSGGKKAADGAVHEILSNHALLDSCGLV